MGMRAAHTHTKSLGAVRLWPDVDKWIICARSSAIISGAPPADSQSERCTPIFQSTQFNSPLRADRWNIFAFCLGEDKWGGGWQRVPMALPHKLITVSRHPLTIVLRLSGVKLIIFYPAQGKSSELITGLTSFCRCVLFTEAWAYWCSWCNLKASQKWLWTSTTYNSQNT